MKKKVVIAGVVVAAIAVVAGLSLTRGKQTEEETLIPVVNVESPKTGSIELYRSLVGKVEPSDVVYIYPKAAGEITDVFVKAGDMVTKGQMIAEPGKGLSVGIHASVNGLVTEVNEKYIVIESQEGRAGNE